MTISQPLLLAGKILIPLIIISLTVFIVNTLTQKRNKHEKATGKALMPQNSAVPKEAAINNLIEAKKKSDSIERNMPYVKLFNRLTQPVQILMALANASDWRDTKVINGIYNKSVRDAALYALRSENVTLKGGRLIFPVEFPASEDYESLRRNALEWTDVEIRQKERRCLSDADSGKISLCMRRVCQDMGEVLPDIIGARDADRLRLRDLADKTRRIYKQSGFFMLFAADPEVAAQPDLIPMFIPSDGELPLPGLFVFENGKYVSLAQSSGTR